MKKLTALAPRARAEKLIRKLMKLRAVEVRSTPLGEEGDEGLSRLALTERVAEQTRVCRSIGEALAVLHRRVPKRPFLQSFSTVRTQADLDAFDASPEKEKATALLERVRAHVARENALTQELARLRAEEASLRVWENYDLPLDFAGTKKTTLTLGSLPSGANVDEALARLYDTCGGAVGDVVSSDGTGSYLAVLSHSAYADAATRLLAGYGFIRLSFRAVGETPREAIEAIRPKIESIEREMASITADYDEMVNDVTLLEVLSDSEATRLTCLEAETRLAATDSTVVVTAYTPASEAARVTRVLESLDCAFEFTDPAEGEDVPVALDTPRAFKPFEMVMGIYSLPAYNTFDPTKIMAFFYALIFGCMMADVGYGLLLAAGCWLFLAKAKPEGGIRDYVALFRVCGFSCMIFGLLFGGWFGDLPTAIFGSGNVPYFMEHGLIPALNPMDFNGEYGGGPINFMVFTLLVGVAHIFTGLGIQFYILTKEGHLFDAICDIGSWFVLFAGIGTFALGAVAHLPCKKVGAIIAGVGVLMIVCTAGRHEKNIVMKFLKGLLGLYGLINYASDILSYSRILALGLATSVIAMVVNLLCGAGGWMVILAVPIMVVAHLFNLALNLLGTFVHTSRLQFIEFFGKFFTDGGSRFEVLAEEDKYTTSPASTIDQ